MVRPVTFERKVGHFFNSTNDWEFRETLLQDPFTRTLNTVPEFSGIPNYPQYPPDGFDRL